MIVRRETVPGKTATREEITVNDHPSESSREST
jgi:hypothetical protein